LHIVNVNPLPTAGISGSTAVCQNAAPVPVAFVGGAGTAPYTFTYNINGGPNQTVVSTGTLATVMQLTTSPGTFTYNLVSVQDASATLCNQAQTGSATIVVRPLPTATISGNNEVCQNATFPPVVFTGAGGTAPYTFTYNINGGPNLNVVSVGNSATININTTIPGTYMINQVSVQDASTTLCSQAQPGSVTVKVNPLPTALISGTTEVCQNAPMPLITFTGAGGTSPYTFTYTINGGLPQTAISVGDIAMVPVNTSTVNTFVYTLQSVQDATATLCSQLQSGTATVIVNPLPTSSFNHSAPSCETGTINFTDLSVPNAGNIISWQWDFGDGSPVITINAPASPNVSHTFASAGTYNVTLITTTDKGCVSITPAQQVIISPRPLAGFIIPEVCLSDTYAQFIDTSKVAIPDAVVAWQWNFGDPGSGPLNLSGLQNPQHSYSAVGPYNVELIVTSNNGCKDTIMQTLFVNGSFPVANFTVPTPAALCANDSVAIVEASTVFPGTITKIEMYWDDVGQPLVFETDNSPFTGKIYKHLYPNFQAPLTQTFTIRYRAYSGGVCLHEKISNITVNAAPLVQFNSMPNICLDAVPYQITQASETGGVPGSGVYTGPGVSPGGLFNPAVAGPGVHTILYTFTSATGGCVDTMSNTIAVYDPPVADFSYSSPDCETKAITFSDNSVPVVGTLTTWTWDFGDGTPLVIRNNNLPFTHVFATWGVYQVKLFVTTSNGCRSVMKIIPVTIHPQPKPNFSIPVSACLPNASVSFGDLSTIADGSQASFTYLWNFDDPASGPLNVSTLANPSHIYTTTGPFNVNLQVTSNNGCVHDTTILLNTVHPQPLASFTTDKIDVCIGSSILFTNTSNPMDGFITQYNWTMDDGNVMSSPTFNYTYSNLGTYNVSLFIFNNHGCRSTTYNKTVFVNPYPPVNAGPDKFMLQGGQVTLTPVLTATMPVTYLWIPSQYLNNAAISNPIASPPDDMTYTLRITTDKGCSATDNVFIKVLKMPAIPNIFSPNGDGIHDVWLIEYLDSYPGCTVDIFNRYGQPIYHSEGYSKPWDGTINGKPVPVGTYYYIVNPKNGRKQIAGYVDVIR
ncbi:MAG: PKD domain-containing protein, partial [Chitinophagaceae bacterium]|nr:PKD domain-containing protein [Chitinophagaceae bacterium]